MRHADCAAYIAAQCPIMDSYVLQLTDYKFASDRGDLDDKSKDRTLDRYVFAGDKQYPRTAHYR